MNQKTENLTEISLELENLKTSNFNQIMLEVIDQTFSKLGQTVKQTLYSCLETNYKLNKEDIPKRTKEFVKAIEIIFGKSALILEIDLMKNMRKKVPNFTCEAKNSRLAFDDYLQSFKKYVESS